ncbi:MAG: hypothetical protein CM1200mP27_08450 [Chloroflexota bacterium]|nr:MAG: hypothetical protein CM1200mP27_08450 [Chloroflexota bacterium]
MVTFLCESAKRVAKAPVIIKSEATVPAYPTFEEIPYSNHWWLINPSSIIAVIVPSNASRLLSISASVCTPENTPLVRDKRVYTSYLKALSKVRLDLRRCTLQATCVQIINRFGPKIYMKRDDSPYTQAFTSYLSTMFLSPVRSLSAIASP